MRQRKTKAVYMNPEYAAGYKVMYNPQQMW